jgi:hypothetical protein
MLRGEEGKGEVVGEGLLRWRRVESKLKGNEEKRVRATVKERKYEEQGNKSQEDGTKRTAKKSSVIL